MKRIVAFSALVFEHTVYHIEILEVFCTWVAVFIVHYFHTCLSIAEVQRLFIAAYSYIYFVLSRRKKKFSLLHILRRLYVKLNKATIPCLFIILSPIHFWTLAKFLYDT